MVGVAEALKILHLLIEKWDMEKSVDKQADLVSLAEAATAAVAKVWATTKKEAG